MKAEIWCSGAASEAPNPGPAGAGYVIAIAGEERLTRSGQLGPRTDHEAAYLAVIHALWEASDKGATEAHLRTDSTVVVEHYLQPHTCEAEHLKVLLSAVLDQVGRFPGGVTIERIAEEHNEEADRLAKAGRKTAEEARRFVWLPGTTT